MHSNNREREGFPISTCKCRNI